MLMRITARHLLYFAALADEGSFGAAARAVSISQPALSMQIRDLEAALGGKLVERMPGGLKLTRLGREVLSRARRVLAEMAEIEALPRRGQGLSGQLNIGVIPTVAPYILPVALTRLRASDLTLDIRVREAQTNVLFDSLDKGRLDAALVALPASGADLAVRPLFEDRFLLAGSRARIEGLAGEGGAVTPKPSELDPEQLLLLDEGHCLADQAIAACGLDPGRRRVDLGASSLATLCGLVAQGFGLTLLPEIAVPSETASAPDMALHRFAAPEPARTLALVRRAGQEGETDWFEALASLFAKAGETLIARARAAVPA